MKRGLSLITLLLQRESTILENKPRERVLKMLESIRGLSLPEKIAVGYGPAVLEFIGEIATLDTDQEPIENTPLDTLILNLNLAWFGWNIRFFPNRPATGDYEHALFSPNPDLRGEEWLEDFIRDLIHTAVHSGLPWPPGAALEDIVLNHISEGNSLTPELEREITDLLPPYKAE